MQQTAISSLIVGLFLLAGCVEPGSAPTTTTITSEATAPPLTATGEAPKATATEDTGSMAVQVVTSELVPVSTAQVVIADTDLTSFTDDAGAATFNELTPGSYTVLAAKPGYNAREDKGRVIEVRAGEVTEVKLTLDVVAVVDADSAYHATIPLTGFLACALEGWPGPGSIGYTTYCGRGLETPAGRIQDPNDKSLFMVEIENVQIRSVVLEGVWDPNNDITGPQLRMIWAAGLQCGATNSCLMTSNAHINVGGHSPLYGVDHEGEKQRLTTRFGQEPEKYPAKSYVETRTYCATNCTLLALTLQQDFDVYITMFYGKEAPAEFRAIPPS